MTATLWGEFPVNILTPSTPATGVQSGAQLQALDDGRFVAVWNVASVDELGAPVSAIYAQCFHSNSEPQGDPVRIDTTADGGVNSNVSFTKLADGRIVYTWEHKVTDTSGENHYSIRARILHADGSDATVGGDFEIVAGGQPISRPLVKALAGGGFALTYNDPAADGVTDAGVKAVICTNPNDPVGSKISGKINDTTIGTQESYALVSLSDGSFVSFYSKDFSGDGAVSLQANLCSVTGGVLSHTEVSLPIFFKKGTIPVVTELKDHNILVVWTEVSVDGTGDNIKAQVFSPAMTPLDGALGTPFIVNASLNGNQSAAGVTALADGGFAITYLDSEAAGAPHVRVALFDHAHTHLGDDTILSSSFADGTRGAPKIVELYDGRLVAVWDEDIPGRIDDPQGIQGQVIDPRTHGIDLAGTLAHDEAVGTSFDDTLSGGADGNDYLNGAEGSDKLYGGIGTDVLDGGTGADQMEGGAADDIYYVDDAADIVIETATGGTNDLVYTSISHTLETYVERMTALTGSGAINLTGNGLANTLVGNNFANVINGGFGADQMQGLGGDDTYIVDDYRDVIIETASGGTADRVFTSLNNYTLAAYVENLTATGTAALTLNGNSLSNHIVGNAAANTINGGAGNDIIDGGRGIDRMVGGLDSDTYYVDNVKDVVVESAGGGYYDQVVTTVSYTLGANVEWGWCYNVRGITLTGNSLNNYLSGNVGTDHLNGGAGNDTLVGGSSADTMAGGTGSDQYYVDSIGDKVIETSTGGSADTVHTGVNYTLTAYVENLVAESSLAVKLTGNVLKNKITGNDVANIINGGLGADTMSGGNSNDTYYVDNAGDKIVEIAWGGMADKVLTTVSHTLAANVEILIAQGTKAVSLTGNGLDNAIKGNAAANKISGGSGNDNVGGAAGNDTILGGYGNDTILGGAGNDKLSGNSGWDTFVFNTKLSKLTNVDTITDFNVADDTIYLENAIFTKLTATGTLNSDSFRIGTKAADRSDHIIYNKATGELFYDADGSGASAAVLFAKLAKGLALTANDFIVT